MKSYLLSRDAEEDLQDIYAYTEEVWGTAQAETYPTPGQRPVVQPATMADDARRRDCTSNARNLPLTPPQAPHLAPAGGQTDMRTHRLR